MTSSASESNPSQNHDISFSMEDFAQALEGQSYDFNRGTIVRGKAFEYGTDGVYVDIGGKSSGFIPLSEMALEQVTEVDLPGILPQDEEREFYILRGQDDNGQVILSLRQLQLQQAWEELQEIQESGKSLLMTVTGKNQGGVTGEVMGLRAFVPRSHLLERDNLEGLLGQKLTVTCLEVNPETKKLVLSQRNAMRATAMKQIVAKTVVTGKVASLKPYGAFVDIGGVAGLLHISQVSGTQIESLTQLFKVHQEIKVVITDVDEYKNRISLSTKVLEEYPGELVERFEAVMANAEERYQAQQEAVSNEAS
ncbi:MAG: S1 RNA-binding domain-containing protein [Jaaginema sp. PMC 1079.18]|nr:S1 RNA-binding domain-containing protein [Jaaginema sp. PMC 1080.18]MEC4852832.1 S1 RNA-binding domain-containing protein [Jaaginema sp. PMC 1079.18]MEC4868066.1 S1 RNA-binding domain-containing protein [Jaaginema sp. PMC 1078.18]